MISSLPSPSFGSLQLGPLKLNAYGVMIAIGVIVAVNLFRKRLLQRGVGKPDDASEIAMIAVPLGVVGARLYHVITDWEQFSGNWSEVIKIWHGGLGIWGGIFVGVIVGLIVARRRGLTTAVTLTCVAPALAFAQSIGRWGNWFNQELFGRPTTLPWALEISDAKTQAAGFIVGTNFHPTFLYESIGTLVIGLGLIIIDRRWKPLDGRLFAMYVASYTFLRFFVESLRIDKAKHIAGLRLNQLTSVAIFSIAIIYLVVDARFIRPKQESFVPNS